MEFYNDNVRPDSFNAVERNYIFLPVAEQSAEFAALRHNNRLNAAFALINDQIRNITQPLAVACIDDFFVFQLAKPHVISSPHDKIRIYHSNIVYANLPFLLFFNVNDSDRAAVSGLKSRFFILRRDSRIGFRQPVVIEPKHFRTRRNTGTAGNAPIVYLCSHRESLLIFFYNDSLIFVKYSFFPSKKSG